MLIYVLQTCIICLVYFIFILQLILDALDYKTVYVRRILRSRLSLVNVQYPSLHLLDKDGSLQQLVSG